MLKLSDLVELAKVLRTAEKIELVVSDPETGGRLTVETYEVEAEDGQLKVVLY